MIIRCIRRFLEDRRGNILPMFGLALLPIMGLIGAAVDYSRANAVKSRMQAALDSTALAMAANAANQTASQLTASATAYFNAMFNTQSTTGVTLSVAYTNTAATGPQVTVNGSTNVKTQFMNIPGFGISQMPVAATSTTAWGNTRLRVALVLDNTGSMADDGKITALKTATTNLLNQLKASARNDGDVYVSIIPFSQNVNIGSGYYSASYIDWSDWGICNGTMWNGSCLGTWNTNANARSQWNGCIADRGNSNGPAAQNYDQNITAPGSTAASKYTAHQYDGCPPQAIKGLSYDWTGMNNIVSNMVPNGGTNQPIGLVWGWQSLVGGGPLTAPAMDPNYNYTQVIILLTDGLNTIDRWYGNGSSQSSQVDSRMYKTSDGSGTCANIKAAGIQLYTIQVNTGGDPTSTMLQKCATSSDYFFLLTDSSQIVTLFNTLGTKLSRLRVAK